MELSGHGGNHGLRRSVVVNADVDADAVPPP